MRATDTNAGGTRQGGDDKSKWQQSTSITLGANYTTPIKPFAKRLAVPAEGITNVKRDQELAKLEKVGNAWKVKGKHFEVEKEMHLAHSKQYQAMGAAVQAATSLTQANTTWNKYQVAVADNRISKSEKNNAIQSIAIEVERHSVELEKKKAALDKSKMDLEVALTNNAQQRLSIEADQQLATIIGNPVSVTLPSFVSNLSGLLQPVEDIKYVE